MRKNNKKVRRLGAFTDYRFTKHFGKFCVTFTIRNFSFLSKEYCDFMEEYVKSLPEPFSNKHKSYLNWKRVQRNNLIIHKPVKCTAIIDCSKISIFDIDKMCCTPSRYWSLQLGKIRTKTFNNY